MDDESYLANLAFPNNRDLALKTLLKRHHEFLTEQKNTKVYQLFHNVFMLRLVQNNKSERQCVYSLHCH